MKKETIKEIFTHESVIGLLVGIAMMIIVFLFVHFVLDIKAFS